jgi:hypothetical protein
MTGRYSLTLALLPVDSWHPSPACPSRAQLAAVAANEQYRSNPALRPYTVRLVPSSFMSSLRPVVLVFLLLGLCRAVHSQPFCATASVDLSPLAIDWTFTTSAGAINYTV